MERTFVMVKPDGVQRGLAGEIIGRLEKRGLRIIALKMMSVGRELAEAHYGEHRGKSFYQPLVDYITSGPVVAMVVEGKGAVKAVRDMMGATDPLAAAPGTIRGTFGLDIGRNVVHGSDSKESAEREIALFFKQEEILSYRREIERWIYEEGV